MILLKLAFKNITHAGIRTTLNVFVLSLAFVAIIMTEGLYDGLSEQIRDTEIDCNIGGGQFWQKDYDPYDPFTFEKAHAEIPENLQKEIKLGNATPVLIVPAAIFPRNIIQTVRLRGVDPNQKVVNLPTSVLNEQADTNSIPGFIGYRMAKSTGLQAGDYVSTRWRNANGTFDATDIKIVKVVEINVPLIDKDQVWIPIDELCKMMHTHGQATIITLRKKTDNIPIGKNGWIYKDYNFLLKDINDNIDRKRIYSSFMYIILIGMALLAVFDTQVLSIFRRRKEIGTLMALGMTKLNVIILFTIEGCLSGIMAFFVGAVYGIPLLSYLSEKGIVLPKMVQQSQYAINLILYPKYGLRIYIMTTIVLFVSVIIVSYLPTRKITKLKPTDALKGKFS
jgi:putative ABC transport system permease protein